MHAHWPSIAEVIHATANQVLSLNVTHALMLRSTKEKGENIFNTREGRPGVRFDQAYDMQTLKPMPAWQQLYDVVKAELRGGVLVGLTY